MKQIKTGDFLESSVSKRIQLVEDIWDSMAALPDSAPLPEEQKDELDRRLSAYHKDPSAGSPWELVKDRIRKRS